MIRWLFRRKPRAADEQEPGQRKPRRRFRQILCMFVVAMHVLGAGTAVQAIMSTRTSQGAIAWAVSLVTFPYVSVPAYWVFGQSNFDGYKNLRHAELLAKSETESRALKVLSEQGLLLQPQSPDEASHLRLLESISMLPLTKGNSAKLLIDGQQTFDAILQGIETAEEYILVQFYILRDDDLGQRLKQALIKKAKAGVRVYVLYDELGSNEMSVNYRVELRTQGVQIVPFNTTQGVGHRFRLNFRNHRKIVVVDGLVAYVGGHNVGDEYLGKHPKLTPWRDTHVELRGPVVHCVQAAFVEDWNWATKSIPEVQWEPKAVEGQSIAAACIPTGPADELETGTLFFLHAINSAKERLWIVSPYFVPDEQLMSALQLAALRGVDVRVLIPKNPDHLSVYLSGISYLEEAKKAGVKVYRYQPGFLHQKVFLIDDYASGIGTANLDNRSMRLNFEITILLLDKEFASEVEQMLIADFNQSDLASPEEYTERWLPFRFLVRTSRLFAPLQ